MFQTSHLYFKDCFNRDITKLLMNKSVEIQQATRVFIDNTPHSCVMTSLQKILELYKTELKQKYGDGKYSHETTFTDAQTRTFFGCIQLHAQSPPTPRKNAHHH